ncbi:SMI1/KNR4 family protein [Acetivibrio cellulolyticus]|uniref:SMI1/KNR4 family protein n=1 Tax=Acetivibrio cellulolyticus TaxID=35830 RepID=UPI0001E2E6AE|nr:SMI1/KNR4 family protein [Acetivibrio cellulolyticus]
MSSIKWRRPGEPLRREDISKIEEIFGICFPEDYVKCVQQYHGASVIPYRVDLNGNVRVFANLLSFSNDSIDNIVQAYNNNKDRLMDGIVPFACDPAGNYFCFDFRKNKDKPSIVFWNHEIAVNADDYYPEYLKRFSLEEAQERAMEKVCNSFSKLLKMLHD